MSKEDECCLKSLIAILLVANGSALLTQAQLLAVSFIRFHSLHERSQGKSPASWQAKRRSLRNHLDAQINQALCQNVRLSYKDLAGSNYSRYGFRKTFSNHLEALLFSLKLHRVSFETLFANAEYQLRSFSFVGMTPSKMAHLCSVSLSLELLKILPR